MQFGTATHVGEPAHEGAAVRTRAAAALDLGKRRELRSVGQRITGGGRIERNHQARACLAQGPENIGKARSSWWRRWGPNRRYGEVLQRLAGLRDPLDAFFSAVMVMSEDAALRQNRLALLQDLRQLFLDVADLSCLNVT